MSEAAKLKKEIDEETKAIWLKEPDEVKKLRTGLIESGAGSYGQYFGTYFFAEGDMRTVGTMGLTTIFRAVSDPEFELSHIYKLSRSLLPVAGDFLGFCGFHTLRRFVRGYLEVMEKEDSREELKGLVGSLLLYVNCLHGWTMFYAPWGLGTELRLKTKEDIKELSRLVNS